MTTPRPFIVRSSAVSGYAFCGRRLSLDRAITEGVVDPVADLDLPPDFRRGSPPADWGTCVHWYSQVALRAEFKGDAKLGDFKFNGFDQATADAFRYTPEQWVSGASMFSNQQTAEQTLRKSAMLLISRLPRKGSDWMAECSGVIPGLLSGHIDLLSADLDDIVDIKTTGTPPKDGKIETKYLWQLVSYALLVAHHTGHVPKRAHIVYVDRHAEWVCRTKPLDFTTPAGAALLKYHMDRLVRMKDRAQDRDEPVPGPHCDDCFCPYRPICRDALVPDGAAIVRPQEAIPLSVNPFNGAIP
jgi:hypothetical protein